MARLIVLLFLDAVCKHLNVADGMLFKFEDQIATSRDGKNSKAYLAKR
jgi:hypothetical protein